MHLISLLVSSEMQSNVAPQQGSLSFGVKDKEDSEEYILMDQSEEDAPDGLDGPTRLAGMTVA